jgi:hypothetical protein
LDFLCLEGLLIIIILCFVSFFFPCTTVNYFTILGIYVNNSRPPNHKPLESKKELIFLGFFWVVRCHHGLSDPIFSFVSIFHSVCPTAIVGCCGTLVLRWKRLPEGKLEHATVSSRLLQYEKLGLQNHNSSGSCGTQHWETAVSPGSKDLWLL